MTGVRRTKAIWLARNGQQTRGGRKEEDKSEDQGVGSILRLSSEVNKEGTFFIRLGLDFLSKPKPTPTGPTAAFR